MTKILVIFFCTILGFSSLFGWGRLTEKLFRFRLSPPLAICTGMSAWIFIGGIVNLFKIAYPIVLNCIFLAGLLLSTITFLTFLKLKSLNEIKQKYLSTTYLKRILPSGIIILFIFFISAYYLSSPSAYNFHDDMEKYFCHPVRMLETGTLAGSKFNALGSETFGAQAFLQGFVLTHFPIENINVVDAVFAFTLLLIIILFAAEKNSLPKWLIPLIVLIPILINPQYVNVSSIYTGSVLILLLLFVELNDPYSGQYPSAALFGLVYSALIALKTIFIVFLAIHFIVFASAIYFTQKSKTKSALWAFKVIVCVFLFICPWILVYMPIWKTATVGAGFLNLAPDRIFTIFSYYFLNLFSPKPLFYGFGNSFLDYTLAILICGFLCVLIFVNNLGNKKNVSSITLSALISCISIFIFYLTNNVFIPPFLLGQEHGLRYTCPAIIAALPASLIMCSAFFKSTLNNNNGIANYKKNMAVIAFFSFIILLSFSRSSIERYKQTIYFGSVLSAQNLAKNPNYIKYNRLAFKDEAKSMIRSVQQTIPKGKAFVVWTPLQFHLDYSRNTVFDTEPAGLASPWVDIPFKGTVKDAMSYFKKNQIKYIIWEYRGAAIRSKKELVIRMTSPFPRERSMALKTTLFYRLLSRIYNNSKILFNNGSITVLKIPD